MAFKQNLPVLGGLAIAVGGVVALVVALRRTDDELVREAAEKYAAPLGTVTGIQVRGTIADIAFSTRPVLYAEFRNVDGRWTFSKDLAEDFEKRMKDPARSDELLKHLAQKIADTDNVKVTVKPGMEYKYSVVRNDQGLVAEVDVRFSYPKGESQHGSGLFIETFRYEGGDWQSQSTSLLKQGPRPPR